MKTPFQQHSQYYTPQTDQQPDQIVDISTWAIGGEFTHHPEGTRAKYEVTCPGMVGAAPFLKVGHRYLYKKTFERRGLDGAPPKVFYDQFWVEIVAYHVGRALGVEVPPAFVACRWDFNGTGEVEYAALIEWFYNYPNHVNCRVDRGGDIMSQIIDGYDREKGQQHNFSTIREFFTSVLRLPGWEEAWVRMLTFDAIIGNTDRHQENWELVHFPCKEQIGIALSPAFDNGTAMGYDVLGKDVAKYIEKGTHQMRWQENDKKRMGHFSLIEKLIEALPTARETVIETISKDMENVYNTIMGFTQYELQNPRYALSEQRARWMVALLRARIDRIRKLVST